ncbi:MAG: hypothetical protein ACREQX_10520, partial [Candidatus Binataceae bacterium]
IGFLAIYVLTAAPKTVFNEHILLANALLHGHAWINAPSYMEHAVFRGRDYIVHAPLSAFILVPLVALFGPTLSQTSVSTVIGAVTCVLAWRLTSVLDAVSSRVWLIIFFGIGTTFWYEATLGNSWDFALVVSTVPTLIALNELFGHGRPFVVGIFAGLAFLARYDLVLAWPFYLAAAAVKSRSWKALETIFGFAIAVLVFIWFNEVRFGTIWDISLTTYARHDPWLQQRMGGGSPFQLRFLPNNLYTLFFMAPVLDGRFPYIHPQMQGQALILTSPAFLLALQPSFKRAIPLSLLLAACFSMGPALLVYANGFQQFGTRYYVQVFPFLLALMILGVKERGLDQLGRILIVFSVLLVMFGMWQIRALGYA